jgi:hypothetical protein
MKSKVRGMPWLVPAVLLGLSLAVSVHAAAPSTYYFLVFSNPVAGHEDEYNKWYDHQHAADVTSIPGFVDAQRYVKNDLPFFRDSDPKMPKYLVVYKIVSSDVESVFAEVERRLKTGETYLSPAYDRKGSQSYVYQALGPELKGPGGDAPAINGSAKAGPKKDYLQVVFPAMIEGQEKEFNAFYSLHHAPEVVAIPGFVRAQRGVLARPSPASIQPSKYLALYWAQTSDPEALKHAADAAGEKFTASPAFNRAATRGYTYRAMGPLVDGDKVRAERAKAKAER